MRAVGRRIHVALCVAVLALVAGCGSEHEAELSTPDAGASAPVEPTAPTTEPSAVDSGVAIDLGDADAAVEPPPEVVPVPPSPAERIARVQTDVDALRALLAGTLPNDFDTQRLFDVDLLSPAAVDFRIAQLRANIEAEAALAAEVEALRADAAVESPDAGELDAGDVGPRDAGVEAIAPGDVDASLPVAHDEAEDAERALAAVELERDRLRLQVLELPEEQRASMLSAERERRRIATERETAAARAAAAAEEARRADQAQREALERAAVSESAVQRELLSERARVESARSRLATIDGTLAEERRVLAVSDAGRLTLVHRLEHSLTETGVATSDADALYDLTVAELVRVRRELSSALDGLSAPSAVPLFELHLPPADRLGPFPEDVAALHEAADALQVRSVVLRAEERTLRSDRTARLGEHLHTLNDLRLRLLPSMSSGRREQVLGLGSEGIAQLGRELEQLWLVSRLWVWELRRDVPGFGPWLGGVLARESSRTTLLWLVISLAALITLVRRRKRAVAAIRAWIERRAETLRSARLVLPWAGALSALAVSVGVVLLLAFALDHLEVLAHRQELGALRFVVLLYAGYRVALEALSEGLAAWRVARDRRADGALAARTRRSVRLVLVFGFSIAALLVLSARILGEGYLYSVVTHVAWLGAVPVVLLVVWQWQSEIEAAYPAHFPSTGLAKWLAPDRSSLVRHLASVPAGGRLSVSLLVEASRDLALRFDQSRRAAAFLMRRRLELQADEAPEEVELPEDLVRAFSRAAPAEPLEIDRYPGLDGIVQCVRSWKEDPEEEGLTVALVGERGGGKTSWMRALVRRAEIDASILDVPRGLRTTEDACVFLSGALGLSPEKTVDALVAAVERAGLRRVVLLDHGQNLIVRAIGGTEAVRALAEVSTRTSERIVWVTSFSLYTWLYLARARQSENLFQKVVELERWPEDDLGALIRHRMSEAGYVASYASIADEPTGARPRQAEDRTEEQFLRVLWDYSDGNPTVAMAFWLRSLVPEGDHRFRVRYFRGPDTEALDSLQERSRFALAALVLHENLSTEAAAATLGVSRRDAAAIFGFLRAEGYVEVDAVGHWRVRTLWYRAAIAFLRRQRLLFT